MKITRTTDSEDALKLIHTRNDFYKKKFFFALIIYSLAVMAILILLNVVIYLVRHQPGPLYFVTDTVGHFVQDIPRQLPNMSNEEVGKWTVGAIENAFSYDFMNYRSQLQESQKYFTDYGWQNYMQGLKTTNNLLALTQRKYVIIAKVVSPPKLLSEGLVGGARAWKFQLTLLVTYLYPPFDEQAKFSNPISLTVVVQRQSILTSYKGLGIIQIIANLYNQSTPPNLTASPRGE